MRKYLLNLIPFIISIGCLVAYNMIGSTVASDGTLIEAFYLIPTAWLFLFIGIIGLVVKKLNYIKKDRN